MRITATIGCMQLQDAVSALITRNLTKKQKLVDIGGTGKVVMD